MGMLAASMGLEQGPAGMKKLTVMMKKGQIGMKELFNFLDMAATRAKESGAYDLAINSKTATEARMQSSYKLFAESFGKMFDQEIKAPFKGFEKFLDRMTTWIDEQEKLKKETGEIGKLETLIELFVVSFSDITDGLSMVIEGLAGILDKIPGMDFDIGKKLANRELENSYYDYKGAKSYADRQALSNSGMPGFEQFRKDMFFKAQPKATEADYAKFSGKLGSSTVNSDAFSLLTNPIGSLVGGITNPRTMDNATSRVESLLADIASYTAFAKESAQNLYNKYSTPVTINIDGAQDPILIGNIVEQKIKEQTQIGR